MNASRNETRDKVATAADRVKQGDAGRSIPGRGSQAAQTCQSDWQFRLAVQTLAIQAFAVNTFIRWKYVSGIGWRKPGTPGLTCPCGLYRFASRSKRERAPERRSFCFPKIQPEETASGQKNLSGDCRYPGSERKVSRSQLPVRVHYQWEDTQAPDQAKQEMDPRWDSLSG